MRMRFWFFAAVVAAALAANLALVSARIAQNADEALGSRLAVASAGVRTQIELLDLRTSPRTAAFSPELIEATRPLADASQPARPDERALRAAAAALQPEPDLLVLSTAHGAAVSRPAQAASLAEDPGKLPPGPLPPRGRASPGSAWRGRGGGAGAAFPAAAAPYLEWLARYQAFYVAAWGLFVLVAFVWGLFAGSGSRAQAAGRPAPVGRRADEEAGRRSSE